MRSDGALLLGKGQCNVSILPEEEHFCFVRFENFANDLIFFNKLLYYKMRYTSFQFVDKINDSYPILRDGKIVKIKYIAMSPLKEVVLLVHIIKCSKCLPY